MKAVVAEKYGSPDVLHLAEVAKPVPKNNELLVKVNASSVNALDWHILRGKPFLVRLSYGLTKPKITILGYDIAGVVESTGDTVTKFKPGDAVFGGLGFKLGGFAEYACIPEDGLVATMPSQLTFAEAAAVPVAAVTALKGIRYLMQNSSGKGMLINGAAGGVGTFSVQIAKALGLHVTAVCSTRNVEMVRSLGADSVIDYAKEDVSRNDHRFDCILDNVGNHSVTAWSKILKPNGFCCVVGFTSVPMMLQHATLGPLFSMFAGKSIRLSPFKEPNSEEMQFLKELLESRKIVSKIDKTYPLERVAEAVRYVETGHARAKVVVAVV